MIFVFLIERILSLSFNISDENAEELAKLSMTTPVFIFFHSPYCPHCQKVAPYWSILASKYATENNIVIANADCVSFKKSCKYFMDVSSFPSFAIINKNKTSKTFVERNIEAWTSLVNKFISFGKNYRCQIWFEQADNFPIFVITTPNGAEETCNDILEIQKKLPKSEGHLYADPNGPNFSCQINLNEEYGFTIKNQNNSSELIPYIEEFQLQC